MEVAAPSGTVTFLFTDIEGSTSLWESSPQAMRQGLERHDAILRSAIDDHNGHVFSIGGDGFAAAFARAGDAVAAAADAQRRLATERWPDDVALTVRMGLHTGEAAERQGNYYGTTVNRAARLMGIAHGGQVLVSRSSSQVLEAGTELLDLGEHHLRDLSEPEHVFQLLVAGQRSEFPPLQSIDALPGNLPTMLTTFIGRKDELRHLGSAVTQHRLVTVTGVGGVGKTRVALQLGAELATDFPEGVWFCELAAAQEDEALGDVVAVALRAPARPGMSLVDSVVEFLRNKTLLLLVDNCEHLLTTVGDFIERVLKTCPGVRIVATSREGLGIPGEQLWPLRSLPTPSASDSPDAVMLSDAVQLFVLHALSLDPSFTVDEGQAPAIGEICRRLDGIPLAIELAAARAGAMAPTEIASLLGERFRLLTGGRRRSIERHHTLRATVDWSYSLLGEVERCVFDRLGVLSGTFDAAAAQAIAVSGEIGSFEVLDALAELVGKSMLDAEHHGGLTRYQMLETLRQYALEKLDGRSETDAFRRRHAVYFSDFAQAIGPQLVGPDELTWRPKLKFEADNLRAAVGWAIDPPNPDDRSIALDLLASLSRESVLDRGVGIGNWAERAIEATKDLDSPARSKVMVMAAYGAFHRGDTAAADALSAEVVRTARTSDPATAAFAAQASANVAASSKGVAEAIRILEDVTTWLSETNRYERFTAHSVLAIYRSIVGLVEPAQEAAAISLQAAREIGQPSALALALYAQGMTQLAVSPSEAQEAFEQSMGLTASGASDVVYANCLAMLAIVFERDGRTAEALDHARRSLVHYDLVGDRPPTVGALHSAGRLLSVLGDEEGVAVLGGLLFEGWFRSMSIVVQDDMRVTSEMMDEARHSLGEQAFVAAWNRGSSLEYEGAIAFALDHLDRAIGQVD